MNTTTKTKKTVTEKIVTAKQATIIQGGILGFWFIFWLMNVVDKLIEEEVYLFRGKYRLFELTWSFNSIGVYNQYVIKGFLIIITGLEITIAILFLVALYKFFKNKSEKKTFYLASFFSAMLFTFFTVGDQVFGERLELFEHTFYFFVVLWLWQFYIWLEKEKRQ